MLNRIVSRGVPGLMAAVLVGIPGVAGASSPRAPSGTGAPHVVVSAFSEKGDFIGDGHSEIYSSRWSTPELTTSGVTLVVAATNGASAASFSFDPVAGQTLSVGDYTNLQPASSRSAGFAGIDITGPGQPKGCHRLTGAFRIWDIAADARGDVTRLDLTYVEHCGAGRPANFGEVLINDAPRVGQLEASASRLDFPDQTPTLPYELTNPTPRAQDVSLWQSATTVSHFVLSAATPSCARSVPAHSTCTYLVRLVPPRLGFYHATVLVSSAGAILRLPLSGPAGGA